ncbi:glycoside hydrolase family 2 TIM barrel-domain containing protein, partial [Candidatus Omnitrophota bacterium]
MRINRALASCVVRIAYCVKKIVPCTLNPVPWTLLLLVVLAGCGKATNFQENPSFALHNKGTEDIINYKKYGEFQGAGTADYKYVIKDQAGLSKAAGEGIYPNASLVQKDPEYKRFRKDGKLKGTPWEFISSTNYQANFYKWATAPEERGVKLFYTAFALEKSGHIRHAIKAYYSLVIHFPKTVGWTYWHTPWPVSQVAIDRINYLCKNNPELGWKLIDASILIKGGYDDNVRNDIYIVNPGRLIRCKPRDLKEKKRNVGRQKVIKSSGDDHIRLIQYEDKSWQLLVDGQPYIIKGVAYQPSKIGQSPDKGTLEDWMQADYNRNQKIDGPYDTWIDENRNNLQDSNEGPVGDFNLLWNMGANTIRIYHHASNKALLRDLYENYGIMSMMGDFIGAYAIGSGATWYKGTDYTDPGQRKNMLESIRTMVKEYKDEPYVLLWVLGNENNYGVANNSKVNPEAYYKFVNEAAEFIKSLDPH